LHHHQSLLWDANREDFHDHLVLPKPFEDRLVGQHQSKILSDNEHRIKSCQGYQLGHDCLSSRMCGSNGGNTICIRVLHPEDRNDSTHFAFFEALGDLEQAETHDLTGDEPPQAGRRQPQIR
jgi:hypothetical protein